MPKQTYTVIIEYATEQEYSGIEATSRAAAELAAHDLFKQQHPHINTFLSTVTAREET